VRFKYIFYRNRLFARQIGRFLMVLQRGLVVGNKTSEFSWRMFSIFVVIFFLKFTQFFNLSMARWIAGGKDEYILSTLRRNISISFGYWTTSASIFVIDDFCCLKNKVIDT
jgi:hypothetical protein